MLECKQLLSRNRERLPLHKFFPLLFQSIIRQLVFRSVSPPPPKNLGFIASYMLQFKPVFTRRKLWAYWLSSTFLPLSREELVLVTLTCQLFLLPWKDAIFRKRMLVERNGVQKAGLQCKRSRSRFAIQSHSYSIVEEWRQVKSNKKERTVALIPSSPFQTRSSYWIFQFISIGGEGGIILLSQPWEQFRTFQRSRIFRDKVGILNHACLNLHWLGMRTCPRLLQTCGGMFPVLCFGWTWLGFVDKLDRNEGAGAWLMSGRFELDRAWLLRTFFVAVFSGFLLLLVSVEAQARGWSFEEDLQKFRLFRSISSYFSRRVYKEQNRSSQFQYWIFIWWM